MPRTVQKSGVWTNRAARNLACCCKRVQDTVPFGHAASSSNYVKYGVKSRLEGFQKTRSSAFAPGSRTARCFKPRSIRCPARMPRRLMPCQALGMANRRLCLALSLKGLYPSEINFIAATIGTAGKLPCYQVSRSSPEGTDPLNNDCSLPTQASRWQRFGTSTRLLRISEYHADF